jgi:hypothetical protein
MATSGKPWEKYSPAPAATGKPWEKYGGASQAAPAKTPEAAPQPKAFSAEDLKKVPQTFTANLLQSLGSMGSTLLAPFDYLVPEEYGGRPNRRAEITNALNEIYQPSSTGVSGFAGGVGNALPIVTGTAGLGAPATVAQAGLRGAIATGGLSRTVANLPTRVVGGGIGGATAAGYVNPEDMATGAAIGAALPVVGGIVGQPVRKLIEAYNALGPGAAKARVGEMLREAAGSRLGATQAAQAAQPNQLASLASAEASTPAYQAMMRIGQELDPEGTSYFANQAATQNQRAAISRAAGGTTQTEARAVRERTKEALDEVTRPMRNRALELAGIGGTRGRALQGQAETASRESAAAAEDVRRFGKVIEDRYFPFRDQPRAETPAILGGARAEAPGVQERANDWARNWTSSTGAGRPAGMPIPPVGATFPGELVQRAEQVAGQRAGQSLTAGEARREAEMRLASLKAAGLEPLRPDSVLKGIRSKLATPEGAINENSARVLTRVEKMLADWTNQYGDITPEALYAIRKWGVSSAVDDLMSAADPASKKRIAAQVIAEVNPLIDNAIEKAGGKGWRDYTRTYAEGMKDIERKELLAKAMELYDRSPDEFMRLINAESPDVVESILGPGKYDVFEELTQNLGPLEKVVSDLRTRALAGEKATEGAKAAGKLIAESERNVRIPNFFSAKVTLTNEVLRGLEGKISADALNVLSKATRSGQAANEAMMALSPTDRSKAVQFVRQYITRNPKLRGVLAAARPGAVAAAATNALSPPTQNALAEQ